MWRVFVFIFVSWLGITPVYADEGFRCGTRRLVSVGDRMADVRNRCGDADDISARVERRKVKVRVSHWVNGVQVQVTEEREVEIPIEEWTYDLGPQSFIRTVVFENGTVVNIVTGGYGRK